MKISFSLASGWIDPCAHCMYWKKRASIHFLPMNLLIAMTVGSIHGLARAEEISVPGGPLEATASRGVTARDPSTIVREGDTFWVFYTGRGVRSLHSKDLVTWEKGPDVFEEPPEWVAKEVPENKGGYWAPDLLKVGGRYLLYYSVSSFGAMRSAIGLATNPTLDPANPAFHWTDEGVVVQSKEGGDFNAIDPAIFQDDDGKLWMSFGSQWSGLKLIELDPATGKRMDPDAEMHPIAAGKSIEAAYIYKRKGFYYLFLNRGDCCQGDKSTYHIKVGRSESIQGPYQAQDGTLMLEGGGTMVLDVKTGPLTGPGHAGIIEKDGKSWFSCHFEADDRMEGKATLGIMPIQWTEDGWPEGSPPDGSPLPNADWIPIETHFKKPVPDVLKAFFNDPKSLRRPPYRMKIPRSIDGNKFIEVTEFSEVDSDSLTGFEACKGLVEIARNVPDNCIFLFNPTADDHPVSAYHYDIAELNDTGLTLTDFLDRNKMLDIP